MVLWSFTSIKRIFSATEEYAADHRNLSWKYIKENDTVLEIGYEKGANDDYYADNISLVGLDRIAFGVENYYDKNAITTIDEQSNKGKCYVDKDEKSNYSRRGIRFNGVVKKGVGEPLLFLSKSFDM